RPNCQQLAAPAAVQCARAVANLDWGNADAQEWRARFSTARTAGFWGPQVSCAACPERGQRGRACRHSEWRRIRSELLRRRFCTDLKGILVNCKVVNDYWETSARW